MWLSIFILTVASISLGFLLGWIACRPRRWDYVYENGAARRYTMDEPNRRKEPKEDVAVASLSSGR